MRARSVGSGAGASPLSAPVPQVIGLHIAALGAAMLVPFALDLADGNPNASGFLLAAMVTVTAGLGLTVATWTPAEGGLSRPQAFVLTVAVWTLLPAFGALPFVFAEPFVSYTDAFFESMSGMTTTGSTVFTGLDDMPPGSCSGEPCCSGSAASASSSSQSSSCQ
jgi:trk system potassium uptake protein TrkH